MINNDDKCDLCSLRKSTSCPYNSDGRNNCPKEDDREFDANEKYNRETELNEILN